MGVVKAALSDAVLTSMWVFCVSTLRVSTSIIQKALGFESMVSALVITTTLIAFLVLIFTLIGSLMGGASFNPTGTASFFAAGVGDTNLISMAFRFPAQAIGAVGGAMAIMEVMPAEYKHMLGGPSLKVDLHTGAIAEGVLTFIISFAILFIVLKGPKNPLVKVYLIAMSTVSMVIAGAKYTGPAMNPANAFGWAYVNNRHDTWEHFYVYWISPFTGAILAAWIFRAIFPPPVKEKKA